MGLMQADRHAAGLAHGGAALGEVGLGVEGVDMAGPEALGQFGQGMALAGADVQHHAAARQVRRHALQVAQGAAQHMDAPGGGGQEPQAEAGFGNEGQRAAHGRGRLD